MTTSLTSGRSFPLLSQLLRISVRDVVHGLGGVSEKVPSGDPEARTRYLTFLSSGGSKYPIDLLKDAGVDMTTDEPLQLTIQKMNRVMDEMDKLMASRSRKPYGSRISVFDLSSDGRRFHSKNAQVRFHESTCSGVSCRSSVLGSTRRLNV